MSRIERITKKPKERGGLTPYLFLLIILVIVLISAWMTTEVEINIVDTELIRKAVRLELADHPKATLVDLYKNFFQDAFGPGHMITDKNAAENYLNRELENSERFENSPYQALGYKHKYFRVNLSLVKNGTIHADTLLHAFVASANRVVPSTLEEWKREWGMILDEIVEMGLEIEGFDDDRVALRKMLDEGKYVVHHSETYIRYYDPHYRIVDRENFERLKKYIEE